MLAAKVFRSFRPNWQWRPTITFYRTLYSSYSLRIDHGKTFNKLLIANRGEVACRIIKTAKKMRIKTVAVYSDSDANSLHVKQADEAIHIGASHAAHSYNNISNIMKAIKDSHADAVHPGYGFLAENIEFVQELVKEGVTFIGPNERCIRLMRDKIQSKIIANKAGIQCIPGFQGAVECEDDAVKIAKEVGFPVMIKSSIGGGWKGMKIAENEEEVRDFYNTAKSEFKTLYGDDRLYIEKYINNPRHIEIQIVGDKHDNYVYLPERECSIQRKRKKVIEEAPSIAVDSATRKAMGEQAVALAKSLNYDNVGTVEYLLDSKGNFYFLEMNPRMQTEYPVTEYITNLDLVELMIRIAAGHYLPLEQQDVKINGWAINSRIYAEDPEKFLPSIGSLTTYIEPKGTDVGLTGVTSQNVRCDSGVVEGSLVTDHYDSLLCKLVTWGRNRAEAVTLMRGGLNSFVIKGVTHNIPLLFDVMRHPNFRKGEYSTRFLINAYPDGFHGHALTRKSLSELLAVASLIHIQRDMHKKEWKGGDRVKPFKPVKEWNMFIKTGITGKKMGKEAYEVTVRKSDKGYEITLPDDVSRDIAKIPKFEWATESPLLTTVIEHSNLTRELTIQYLTGLPVGFRVTHYGTKFDVHILSAKQNGLISYVNETQTEEIPKNLLAPMPGSIVSVAVKAGDTVVVGNELARIEAMKMQNVLRSHRTGTIKKVNVEPGQTVEGDHVLIEFEDEK